MSTTTTTAAVATQRPTVAVWFEIPAENYERAIGFYETIFGFALIRMLHGEQAMAVFPYERPGVSGCIVPWAGGAGAQGPLVFLNADGILDDVLGRVAAAGGSIALGRTEIGDGIGWFARIIDSEGNRVGLHTIV